MDMPTKNASATQQGPTGPDLYFIATVALCGFLFLLPAVPYLECGSCGGFTVPMVALVAAAASGLLAAVFWYWAAFSASNPVASQVAAGLSGVTVMMGVSLLVGSTVGFPAWVSQFGPWFFYGLGFFISAVLMNVSITVLGSMSGRVVASTPSRPRTPQALLAAPTASMEAMSMTGAKDTVG
jgi:hypothetical protein